MNERHIQHKSNHNNTCRCGCSRCAQGNHCNNMANGCRIRNW